MTRLLPAIFSSALIILSLAAGPARADFTAAALWDHWRTLGGTAAEAADADGGTLALREVGFTRDMGGAPVTATLERMQLRAAPEGGVAVTIPGGQTLTVESEGESGVFRIGPETLLLRATGTLPAPAYALNAPRLALTLEDWQAPDRPAEAGFEAILRGVAATLATGSGASGAASRLSLTAAGLDIAAAAADPVTGTMTHEAAQTAIVLDATFGDTDGTIAMGAGPGGTTTTSTGPRGADTSLEIRKQAHDVTVSWTGSATTTDLAVEGIEAALGGLPIPVDPLRVAIDRAGVTVSGPAAPTEGPAPIAASGVLDGIVPDASVWAQIDPTGALPRDPAYLRFDITGMARPVDPAAASAAPNAAPTGLPQGPMMVPDTLQVNRFEIGAAGAEAQATGTVTLPATGPGGMPDLARPVGELTVTATGIMGLMQALAAAGLVPAEQVMGAQMMMGMFATMGPGDTLRSVIEAAPDGSLRINGTRVR